MYVCICQAVTEKQIREAVEDGVASFCDLNTKLGVGAACGTCESFARNLFEQTVNGVPRVPPAPQLYHPASVSAQP